MSKASESEHKNARQPRSAFHSALSFPADFMAGRKVTEKPLIHKASELGIEDKWVKLKGIDTLSVQYLAQDKSGSPVPVGQLAVNRLREIVGDRPVTGRLENENAPYQPVTSRMLCDGRDIAAQLVSEGWAFAADKRYAALEEHARSSGKGLWAYDVSDYAEHEWKMSNGKRDSLRFPDTIEREMLPDVGRDDGVEMFAVRDVEVIGYSHLSHGTVRGWARQGETLAYFSVTGKTAQAVCAASASSGKVDLLGRTDVNGELVVMDIRPQREKEAGLTRDTATRSDVER